jgi:hypothetical protein
MWIIHVNGTLQITDSCLALFDPILRNWFRIPRLTTMVAIGLRYPMLSQNEAQIL